MEGKIAFEEHWAIEETLVDSERIVGGTDWWPDVRRRLLDTDDLRLTEMDAHGIELTILSLNSAAIQAMLDTNAAIEMSRKANEMMAEQIAAHPDRFRGFAALPMQDADAAAEELTRCVREYGFVGALVNGFTQKDVEDSAIYFDIPEYRSFWATVAELDVPFYLHPRTQIPARMQPYAGHPWLVSASWGFARETSIHALRLIGSGIFDEHPNLQILLGHLGERIPYDMWRLDARIRRIPDGYPLKNPMSHYLRSNFHMTTSGNFNDATFHCAVSEMGLDRILFSVDYPFEDTVDAASWYDNMEMEEADRIQVGRGNAIKLFKLDLS